MKTSGDRTFGILLIVGAIGVGWLYNTGKLSEVYAIITGAKTPAPGSTAAKVSPEPNLIQPVVPIPQNQQSLPSVPATANSLGAFNFSTLGTYYAA